jgi:hypothetical protein
MVKTYVAVVYVIKSYFCTTVSDIDTRQRLVVL